MTTAVFTEGSELGMKTLAELVDGISEVRAVRGAERSVAKVRIDSRTVESGDLFVAIPGHELDGMEYAAEALERGAVGVLASPDTEPPAEGAWLVADDPRRVVGPLASRAWGEPSRHLPVVGLTGTNGKTTTSFLLSSIVHTAKGRPAVFGTLGAQLPQGDLPQARTTPEAPLLQEGLAMARAQDCDVAILEVSSHALDLHRVDGTEFAVAAFLNLSPEHLDWHKTMENYARSKVRLFAELLAEGAAPNGPRAVIHANDPWAGHFREGMEECLLFARGGGEADVTARGLRMTTAGAHFELVTPGGAAPVSLPMPGNHNVDNALAAASVAHVLGYDTQTIAAGLTAARTPEGRFERVYHGRFDAYVDYAHTPDGVQRALEVARSLAAGRVIVVMGCGGNRDEEKRPTMGRLAAELADVAIFTADNPRGEDAQEIINQMLEGTGERRERVAVVVDRREALRWAVNTARAGDVVLALGKGHETYQTISGVNHPFPEREILARLATERDERTA